MKSELAKKKIATIFAVVMVLSAFGIVAGVGDSSSQTIAVDAKDDTLAASEYEKTTDETGATGMYIPGIPDQPGWPITTDGYIRSSPALGDIDGDGDMEVVIGGTHYYDGKVYAWHHDGTTVSGWPKTVDAYDSSWWIFSSPAIGDIDGDGQPEIVIGSDEMVYAWNGDGTTVSGWPKTTGDDVTSGPALGDIDGDGELEVVVGSMDNKVYAWNGDGTTVPGWPITTGDDIMFSTPAIGDIDGDGDLEIVVGSEDYNVYAWHHDGTTVSGWPKTTGSYVMCSPALGDIDGDGDIEIVVGSTDDKVYAWHHDGTTVTGWPKTTGYYVQSSPALGDIDGDGDIEIVVGSWDYKVYAWHHDGTTVSGWPITTGDYVTSSPALGDIDGDGDIEVVVGSDDYKVYVWDCSGTYDPSTIEWGTFHHDVMRTGLYGLPGPPPPKIISVTADKDEYTIGETVYMTLEINRSAEYPVVAQLELELKEPCDTPDMLFKSPAFVMPAVFQWDVTVPMRIDYSIWVSGGKYSFIATLREPSTGDIIARDTAYFEIDDVPWMEKLKSVIEIP